jgi:HEPN domain-containing protein
MNVDEQVKYWQTGSGEDLAAAESLLEKGHLRQCLFFAHLALEKMLKAHVVRITRSVPPRIHNLVRLARQGGLKPNDEQERFLRRFDVYQLEARYPDSQQVILNPDLTKREFQAAMQVWQWLKAQL